MQKVDCIFILFLKFENIYASIEYMVNCVQNLKNFGIIKIGNK
jgi:hypothetical protein